MKNKQTNVLKGLKLANPAASISRYKKRLKMLVKRMKKEVVQEVKNLFYGNLGEEYFKAQKEKSAMDESLSSQARILMNGLLKKYEKLFSKKSLLYSSDMVNQVNIDSEKATERSLKSLSASLTLKGNLTELGKKEINSSIIAENISLIKTIPSSYIDKVQGKLMRSIASGNLQDLTEALSKYGAITDRKVKNIAEDQVRKSFNAVNRERLLSHNIKSFMWLHSGGGQFPRKDHEDMDGKIFDFDDLPIIDKNTGERGIPGQAINCRCTMNPIILLED